MRKLTIVGCFSLLLAASSGSALTLFDLNAGASFSSQDGSLLFEFAPDSILFNGSVPADPSLYSVVAVPYGFLVSGPLVASDGDIGGLTLQYDVSALAGQMLSQAQLMMSGAAFGEQAIALASATLGNGVGLAAMLPTYNGSDLVVGADFAPSAVLEVIAALQVLAPGEGEVAAIQVLRQIFTPTAVSEPAAALMLWSGLSGLFWIGSVSTRPRSRPRRLP